MPTFEELSFSFEEFSGKARLLPLPNLVLFPHVLQPLHIFEPRYLDLLEDALADDRLIAMTILDSGWEEGYEGRPPLHPIGCLGRVTTYHRLEDGTYNILLLGLRRIRLLRELEPVHSFREAEVALCEDLTPPETAARRRRLQRELRDAFLRVVPMVPDAQEQLDQLLGADVSLAMLTDVISYVLPLDFNDKRRLLAEVEVCWRAELLLEHLSAVAEDSRHDLPDKGLFPPQFSVN